MEMVSSFYKNIQGSPCVRIFGTTFPCFAFKSHYIRALISIFLGYMETPEDVGAFHTDAFQKLSDLYKLKKPESYLDMIVDVADITSSYCPNNDRSCISNVYKQSFLYSSPNQIHRRRHLLSENDTKYLEQCDEDVKSSVRKIHAIIGMANELGPDEVRSRISDIQSELKNMKDVDDAHRFVGLIGASVAIESSDLWFDALNNEDHPLHDMRGYFDSNGERRLESNSRKLEDLSLQINNVIMADFRAAMAAGFDVVTSGAVFDYPTIVTASLFAAIPASAQGFFGDFEDDYDYEDDSSSTDDYDYKAPLF